MCIVGNHNAIIAGFFFIVFSCQPLYITSWDPVASRNVNITKCRSDMIASETIISRENWQKAHMSHQDFVSSQRSGPCQVTKTYVPSDYERLHMDKAVELCDANIRQFAEFVGSKEEIEANRRWLKRVHERMTQSISDTLINESDDKYLSRYNFTKVCSNGTTSSWLEWIEPITGFQTHYTTAHRYDVIKLYTGLVHSRHPFAFISTIIEQGYENLRAALLPDKPAHLMSVDHILVQSGVSYDRQLQSVSQIGSDIYLPASSRGFVIDAGIVANRLYGWEAEVNNPNLWRKNAIPQWQSKLHFFNIPITSAINSKDNPLNLINRIAIRQDFVSFKLDIDNSDIEIALVLQLANDESLFSLVDEFFFEFHYYCPVMKRYWELPKGLTQHGISLDRVTAMKLFQDLRFKGVRTHFWP